MKRALLRALLLLSAVTLSACETLAPQVSGPANMEAWQARETRLRDLDAWQMEGRVAIAAYDDGWSASIDWVQVGDHMDVNFSGPLGVGSARIAGTPAQMEVHGTEGEHFVTTEPEADLYWQLGWTAPVDRMAYWVLGIPGPDTSPMLEIDAAGRLVHLQQGEWTVDYVDYRLLDNGEAMPRKLEMRRDGVRIRLVIGKWELMPGR